ncbi:guanine nucleotide-binding protein subunit beta-like protein [Phtheirospermum japonicum]|uniref:Guanine nucleotide-binding protein subunit beta-like protein n=1 Tax=Phtheirospermum japonicum TaxID=374723 RepID=A0A830DAZ4_9LAMI|nr:guanine nucleotide-binding protein subunit beta-like protein [Phtheirospermum japonicum]
MPCNTMPPDIVYYQQARYIQDVAKRDFENLRHEGINGEPQPKVVRRGRPPNSKNQKKLLETPSPLNHGVGLGLSSPADEDRVEKWRKQLQMVGTRTMNFWVPNILRADMKYGKKQFTVDETRRDTYRQFHPLSTANNSSNSIGDMKRLVVYNPWDKFNKLAGSEIPDMTNMKNFQLERDGEDVLGVADEAVSCFACLQVPEAELAVPGAGESELAVRGEGDESSLILLLQIKTQIELIPGN